MAGQSIRMGASTAVTPTTVLVIQKKEMLRVLHAEQELSDRFIAYMLAHNICVEEDPIDQLFNSSEKRLARTLLLLARYGAQEQPDGPLPNVSQETLAEMSTGGKVCAKTAREKQKLSRQVKNGSPTQQHPRN
jgi:CRP/FNR family cyclic AMP-dependent transcriptional regulator